MSDPTVKPASLDDLISEAEPFKVDNCVVEKIENYFTSKAKRNRFNGSVLYAEKGNIVYRADFGYSNIKYKEELTEFSAYNLASVSKPITSAAILTLVEKGEISLEDTIQQFIPEFPYDGISIRNLLTQKSGLPEYLYFAEKHWLDRKETITNDDVLCIMQTHEPERYYRPDYKYNYVNTNYILLASIIERVSKQTFAEYVDEAIFTPLDMEDSFVYDRDAGLKPMNITYGHDDRGRKIRDDYFNGCLGDKGIYCTIDDLYKFDQSFYTSKILSKKTIDEAFTAQHTRMKAWDNYGLGWRINDRPDGSKIVYHSGWWKGYRSYFIRMPDQQKTAIVLTNSTRGGFLKNATLRSLIE